MSARLHGILFWGLAFTERGELPWHKSADYEATEAWNIRLARRIRNYSHMPDDFKGIYVGYHVSAEAPMFYVAIESSYQAGGQPTAAPVADFEVGANWRQRLQRFCEVMDIPWSEPGWHLATLLNH